MVPIRSITEEELCDLVEAFEVLSGVSTPRDGGGFFDESSCALWVRHAQEDQPWVLWVEAWIVVEACWRDEMERLSLESTDTSLWG